MLLLPSKLDSKHRMTFVVLILPANVYTSFIVRPTRGFTSWCITGIVVPYVVTCHGLIKVVFFVVVVFFA